MINAISKTCLACGESLRGRADKKFCSDQCRSGYNNSIKSGNRDYIRRVNYILKKNRRILTQLQEEGQKQIPIDLLRGKGFDFNYFTSLYASSQGINFFCYEHGFIQNNEENRIILVTREGL
jgi:predicted nucleic acid-binding Zn ribbon protein